MTLDVLMSTLSEKSPETLLRMASVTGSAVLVNQAQPTETVRVISENPHWIVVETPERGLSRSRNRALRESRADYCLLADDDELFNPDYEARVLRAFQENADADILAFEVHHWDRERTRLPFRRRGIGPWAAMRLTSVQLALRRESVLRAGVEFDEDFGSGSAHGSGEEYIFLRDAMRAGLTIGVVGLEIASLRPGQEASSWFSGVDSRYLESRGAIFRRADPVMYPLLSLQWVLRKRTFHGTPLLGAYRTMLAGASRDGQVSAEK